MNNCIRKEQKTKKRKKKQSNKQPKTAIPQFLYFDNEQ